LGGNSAPLEIASAASPSPSGNWVSMVWPNMVPVARTAKSGCSPRNARSSEVTGSAGGPFTVTFTGSLQYAGVALTLGTNGLTGGTTPSVTFVNSGTGAVQGLTDLYAYRVGLDGFHGVSMLNGQIVKLYPPDFTIPGAVKTGEVEIGPVAVALKATKSAAVWRNIKVA